MIYNINRSERFPQIQPWDFLVRLWGETVARCSQTLSKAPGELIPYGRPVALHRRRSYQIPHPSIWLLLEKLSTVSKKNAGTVRSTQRSHEVVMHGVCDSWLSEPLNLEWSRMYSNISSNLSNIVSNIPSSLMRLPSSAIFQPGDMFWSRCSNVRSTRSSKGLFKATSE